MAGASLGTIFASLANNMPDNNHYKSWIVILAPAGAIAISWSFQQLYKMWKRYENAQKWKNLKSTIKEHIDDPTTPPKERERLTKLYYDINRANIERIANSLNKRDEDLL